MLTKSLEGRVVEMLTITSKSKIKEEKEPMVEGLFPEGDNRPNVFEKPVVFISSRVHPGESPASIVLNGILRLLFDESSPYCQPLLDNFCFKIVPLLNPDGVYRGYYRSDTLNQNLNRYYTDPDPKQQPSIWAVKEVVKGWGKSGRLLAYVDLHAHANKKGCFMFGNNLTGEA